MTANAIRVAVAAGGAALRAGLLSLFAGLAEVEVVSASSSPEDLPFDLPFDVLVWAFPPRPQGVVLNDTPAAGSGLLLLVNSAEQLPPVELLVGGGARPWGALPVEASLEELRQAVLALSEGLSVLPPAFLNALLDRRQVAGPAPEGLTRREVEVLEQLAQGQTNKQIALALGISEHTVKFHISAIYGKLGVLNRAEAVQVGIRQGWIVI